jgi:DNA invertase Pin-like site-specific DNA recombinase
MMTSAEPIPATILKRKAVVYVRQSTQSQVMNNLESKRRQYDLVDVARQRGFRDVEVIDDDLGRSASGAVARPGFDRLVASLCAGKVGAVLCFDASRLARNGRDWHHLLELCGLVEARVIDLEGVYNPCRPNDRLLLGMKGSISEFELGVLRARMLDAARSKASRGELRISFRSAISGTAKPVLESIRTCVSKRRSGSSSPGSVSLAVRDRYCFQ